VKSAHLGGPYDTEEPSFPVNEVLYNVIEPDNGFELIAETCTIYNTRKICSCVCPLFPLINLHIATGCHTLMFTTPVRLNKYRAIILPENYRLSLIIGKALALLLAAYGAAKCVDRHTSSCTAALS
jgi:hypothetical protein